MISNIILLNFFNNTLSGTSNNSSTKGTYQGLDSEGNPIFK
jgi:hypothetical protein